ncbi:MAG TPA: ligase-associated DNA damage response endonuclease PdeM [Steroidobacteraceae bacterium]|nr:ligase-associated DNA damage response endonuclease PdeM [Steroidobacteraceae bacterium]
MTEHRVIELAGEEVVLHRERALFWVARRTLFIADLHLGKSDFFRRAGIAIPEGTTQTDLERLTRLIDGFAIENVIVLGDFVHGRSSERAVHLELFMQWRRQHRAVNVVVVAGNHDRHVQGNREQWEVEWVQEGFRTGPFICTHHPRADTAGFVLSGHVHPVMKLQGSSRERVRIPVLQVRSDYAILPSFGSFTGGAEIEVEEDDRVFGFAAERVWQIR